MHKILLNIYKAEQQSPQKSEAEQQTSGKSNIDQIKLREVIVRQAMAISEVLASLGCGLLGIIIHVEKVAIKN